MPPEEARCRGAAGISGPGGPCRSQPVPAGCRSRSSSRSLALWRRLRSGGRPSRATSPSWRSRCAGGTASRPPGGPGVELRARAAPPRLPAPRRSTSSSRCTSRRTTPTLATSSRRAPPPARRRLPPPACRRYATCAPCARTNLAPSPSLRRHLPPAAQGFNEFLTSKSAQAKNKNRQFRLEDRVFSLSSITSPGVRAAGLPCCCAAGPVAALHRAGRLAAELACCAGSCAGLPWYSSGPCCMPSRRPAGSHAPTEAAAVPALRICRAPQTLEMQTAPADQAAVYGGVAPAVPAFQARAVAQPPPPKRRY